MYCQKCKEKNSDSAIFCKNCGERLSNNANKTKQDQGVNINDESHSNDSSNYNRYANRGIFKRNIAASVVFSIITCGIYGLYWVYKINEEVNIITNHEDDTSGGLVILFGIITCGIYYVYWAYKIGDKLKCFYNDNNSNEGNDLPILYLILFICNYIVAITGIICYCLMQDRINKIVEGR